VILSELGEALRMVIVQINYRYSETPEQWATHYPDERAKPFLSVPGLKWKIWLDGAEERRTGGIYLFEDRQTADAYIASPIMDNLRANPAISELEIRVFGVRDRLNSITNAPVPATVRS
jgi:putative monooxygenase ydhR